MKRSLFIIILILTIDQASKFWIKTNMTLGQDFNVIGGWFLIHFTENPGMAFGLEFGGERGKLILTLLRLVAVTIIGIYLVHLHRKKAMFLLILSVSLIMAGALGNIIDSVFYGVIFSESTFFERAVFLPADGGYAPLLHGSVVDMFYFPIIQGYYPNWFPIKGGENFIFFRPVFNVADSSITTGVLILLVFQKRLFHVEPTKENKA